MRYFYDIKYGFGTMIFSLMNIVLLLIGIYIIVLIIKVLRRSIKALDIYLSKNSSDEDNTNKNDNYYSKYDR